MTNPDRTMDIWSHIEELRRRLLLALVGLIVATLVSLLFADIVIEYLAIPIGGLENIQSIEVTENVGVFMKVALLSGVILALPFISYQAMAFILPGLRPNERRWVYFALPLVTVFFVGGVAFAFYVMLPAAIPFLTEFLGVTTIVRLSSYMDFSLGLMFWIGVSFLLPLIVFVLAKLRFVSSRQLAKQWRFATVIIAIAAAMITPTVDPVNMGLLMLPLFILYWLSVFFAFLARRNEKPIVDGPA